MNKLYIDARHERIDANALRNNLEYHIGVLEWEIYVLTVGDKPRWWQFIKRHQMNKSVDIMNTQISCYKDMLNELEND